jgi:hypothetical protein
MPGSLKLTVPWAQDDPQTVPPVQPVWGSLDAVNRQYVKDLVSGIVAGNFLVPIGDTPPANPQDGQLWYRTTVTPGLYMWYTDTTSSQWIQV